MRKPALALSCVLALSLGALSLHAQTPTTGAPEPGSVPVTSQTPVTPNGTTNVDGVAVPKAATAAPMSKHEHKAVLKEQRREEKSASDNAKAAKANAKALKAQDKANNAAEQAQPH